VRDTQVRVRVPHHQHGRRHVAREADVVFRETRGDRRLQRGSVMVWVEDGWLSHLEIYWWSDDAPTEFPDLRELTNHRLG